jgi:molybdate transport repressor ModE-like protein
LVALSSHVPDLSSLELLLAVARTGSLGAAGRELGLTQQAVSARIRTVERLIGVPVVSRGPRGSRLTEPGALVADWAGAVLTAAEALDAGIAALRGQRDARLTVASSLTVAEYLLPSWLVALRTEQVAAGTVPATVRLGVHNTERVAALVLSGEAGVGFIEGPDVPAGLAARPVGADTLVLVVAPGHRWARRSRPLEPTELAVTPLVAREAGSGTRRVLEAALASVLPAGVEPVPPALELSSTASIRGAVLAGAGAAVLSDLAVREDLAAGRLVEVAVRGLALRRVLRGVWASGPAPAGPVRDLLRIAAAGS